MSSTKWQQFWSGRIEAPYRFALHDYLARPRAYATISTAEMCLKLINSSWPDGLARITASYRCAAQGPRLAVCSPPSSWQAGLSPQDIWRAARPGALSGAWLLSRIWFIYECLKRLTELPAVCVYTYEFAERIIHLPITYCWYIYIYIYMYIQQLKKTVYTLIFLVLINVWKVF